MIVEDMLHCIQERHKPIVLSDRKEYLEKRHAMLTASCPQDEAVFVILEGALSPRQWHPWPGPKFRRKDFGLGVMFFILFTINDLIIADSYISGGLRNFQK